MNRPSQVYNWLKNRLPRLAPHCVLCGDPGEAGRALCGPCRMELPPLGPACRCCASPLPEAGGSLCGHCRQKPSPLEHTLAPFRYQAPLDRLLLDLKFNQKLHLARLLGELLAAHFAPLPEPELPQLLIPVPLHPTRLRQRGYNQALELARPVARRLKLGLDPHLCRRMRATDSQSGLKAAERARNVRGAFAVVGKVPAHVAIVDDVVTTGSTVTELARALRRAGAARVDVWALARATGR